MDRDVTGLFVVAGPTAPLLPHSPGVKLRAGGGPEAVSEGPQRRHAEAAHGSTVGPGPAQMLRAPGKMFSRVEILAILRGRLATLKASAPDVSEAARFEIEYVIRIFENLE